MAVAARVTEKRGRAAIGSWRVRGTRMGHILRFCGTIRQSGNARDRRSDRPGAVVSRKERSVADGVGVLQKARREGGGEGGQVVRKCDRRCHPVVRGPAVGDLGVARRDLDEDRASNKRTLAVRFGPGAARAWEGAWTASLERVADELERGVRAEVLEGWLARDA